MSYRPRAFLAARALTSAAVALAGFLGARTGAAQPASLDGVDVTYTSPQECSGEDAYRRILATLLRASAPPGPPRVRAIAASIRVSAGRYRGQLTVTDADGRESAREIAAPTCDEAVNALAFLAALAMGFDVATLSPDSSRTSPGSAGASAIANGDASTRPVPPAPALSPPPPASEEVSKGASLGQPAIVWSLTASLESTLGVAASGLEPGASLMLRASLGDAPVLAPSFALGAIYADGGSVGDPGGPRASEQLYAGWLEACPIRLRFSAHLEARPCASLVAGAMVGSASGIVGARRKALPWRGTIALARLDWSPADPVVLDLHAGVSAAFERTRFYFSPDTELYAPSTVGAVGGAGVAVRFPWSVRARGSPSRLDGHSLAASMAGALRSRHLATMFMPCGNPAPRTGVGLDGNTQGRGRHAGHQEGEGVDDARLRAVHPPRAADQSGRVDRQSPRALTGRHGEIARRRRADLRPARQ